MKFFIFQIIFSIFILSKVHANNIDAVGGGVVVETYESNSRIIIAGPSAFKIFENLTNVPEKKYLDIKGTYTKNSGSVFCLVNKNEPHHIGFNACEITLTPEGFADSSSELK